jgi:DNA-binding transcriptional LysR family regulator
MARDGVLIGQLEAFVAVARIGNVTRAAETLFLTQPALTARLQRLEGALGATLLLRDHQGARLTDAGRAFLPHAEAVLEAYDEGERAVDSARDDVDGELRIGATPTISAYVLPGAIRSYRERYPRIRLSVRTVPSENVLEHLLHGEVDLGLGRDVPHRDVESTPLYMDELVVVCDPGHRFAGGGPVDTADLGSEVLVSFDASPGYHGFLESLRLGRNGEPGVVIDADHCEAVKGSCAQAPVSASCHEGPCRRSCERAA